MSSTLIGVLLDGARHFSATVTPRPITMSKRVLDPSETDVMQVEPRSVARALLAQHLRCLVERDNERSELMLEDDSSYNDIVAVCQSHRRNRTPAMEHFDHIPDIILRLPDSGLAALEVGYGFVEADAIAAIDRLLGLVWHLPWNLARPPVNFVGYIFVHELSFGESIAKTERAFVDWIDAHFGPFNGISRSGIPMLPRLTRTSSVGPRDGTVLSAIDLKTRPSGFAGFCISYEVSGY